MTTANIPHRDPGAFEPEEQSAPHEVHELRLVPDVAPSSDAPPHSGNDDQSSTNPNTGWALEPGSSKRNAHPDRRRLGATAAVVIATVVVLAALGVWGAFSTFASQGHLWQSSWIPVGGQPYNVKHIKNVVAPPSIANTAKAVAQAKLAAKENPMVVTTPSTHVVLKLNAPPLGGRYIENGQIHADFAPSYFAVPAGKTIHVIVLSYDTGFHTFTAPEVGLNVWIRPAKGSTPSKTTFTFKAPSTGYISWFCDVPCDPYSMSHGGLMKGEIHVVKA